MFTVEEYNRVNSHCNRSEVGNLLKAAVNSDISRFIGVLSNLVVNRNGVNFANRTCQGNRKIILYCFPFDQ